MINTKVKLLDLKCLPEKAHVTDAGYDLKSRHETVKVLPGMTVKVPTGIIVEFPKTAFGLLVPRSGLGSKYGMRLLNTVGIIDPDYRGEIIAFITAEKEFTLEKYDRFVQLIFVPFMMTNLIPNIDLAVDTARGSKGFGDSGVK